MEARRRAPRLGTSARAGRRLPHRWACPGDSLYDHLGPGFTLIRCDARGPDDGGLIAAAARAGLPLTVLDLAGPGWAEHFGARLVLVRPDQHVSWSGDAPRDPTALIRTVIGHGASPAE